MKRFFLSLSLLALAGIPGTSAVVLYDNTTTDTLNTLFYSVGPYTGIGDQIRLSPAPGISPTKAQVQLFNVGGAGTFDALLTFYQVGAPVGTQLGTFTQAGTSAGGDIIDLTFALGPLPSGLPLPRDVIFVVTLANVTAGMDLGVNLFEPPTVGSSDNTFLIVQDGKSFSQAVSNAENVYFRLEGVVPEPSTLGLCAACFAVAGIVTRLRLHKINR